MLFLLLLSSFSHSLVHSLATFNTSHDEVKERRREIFSTLKKYIFKASNVCVFFCKMRDSKLKASKENICAKKIFSTKSPGKSRSLILDEFSMVTDGEFYTFFCLFFDVLLLDGFKIFAYFPSHRFQTLFPLFTLAMPSR